MNIGSTRDRQVDILPLRHGTSITSRATTESGRYTKHIYIGSQRIVSKLGDFALMAQTRGESRMRAARPMQ